MPSSDARPPVQPPDLRGAAPSGPASARLATHTFATLAWTAVAWVGLALGFWTLAGHTLLPGRGLHPTAPQAVTGDEPHYLIMVHSLLEDGDLSLADDYAAARRGGWQAGRRFRGVPLDHHTTLYDPASGEAELWARVYDWRRRQPCHTPGCHGYPRVSAALPETDTRVEAPAHPPAFAAVVAAALAPWPQPGHAVGAAHTATDGLVEARAAMVQAGIAAAAVVVTALLALELGLGWLGALAAAGMLLLSPWTPYGRSLFSEPLAGLSLVVGAWAHVRARRATRAQALWVWAATLAWGAAMWIKPPFVLLLFGALIAHGRAGRRSAAGHALAASFVTGCALLAFNLNLAGVPLISGQLGWRWVSAPQHVIATLTSPYNGLLPFAPWTLVGGAWLLQGLRGPGSRTSREGEPGPGAGLRELGWALALWLPLHMAHGSLGELCWGPRYWVPWLPVLAVATVAAWSGLRRRERVWVGLLVAAGAFATWPGALAWPFVWGRPAWVGLEILGL